MILYKLKKVLSKAFTSLKLAVNGKIIDLFSTYESRNICCFESLHPKTYCNIYRNRIGVITILRKDLGKCSMPMLPGLRDVPATF